MDNRNHLIQMLQRIDGRGYPAYRDIRGAYDFGNFTLFVDHVQGDPYAAPSRLRISVPMEIAAFPEHCLNSRIRQIALRDFLARRFSRACRDACSRLGSGKSGMIAMDAPGQEILERSAVMLSDNSVEARFTVGLPARGRRILGRRAADLLCDTLPAIAGSSLRFSSLDPDEVRVHLDTAEDAEKLRLALKDHGLAAFIAEGSILPRRSGVDERPLKGKTVVPFESPESLAVTIDIPHAGRVTGMGIPEGVTLIAGGGYHGKSTLLSAVEAGVYNHLPGDGREKAVTDPSAVKIRAEDGRSVAGVNIHPFVSNLPDGGNTECFSTENASGSTSQAANIMEAMETGCRLLLLDEDTCATNLLIRDARMQKLVEKAGEPITPFVDRVGPLFRENNVSSILVLGGSGDYFDRADTVIRMEAYRPRNVTEDARKIAAQQPTGRAAESVGEWPGSLRGRIPDPRSLSPRKGKREVSIKTRGVRYLLYGTEEIDLSFVSQLADPGQVRAIGRAIYAAGKRLEAQGRKESVAELAHALAAEIAQKGLDTLDDRQFGDYAAFRPCEFAAAMNRLRTLRMAAP
ncbi:MAG: ABC-ATPase domain-containing protein [Kiritimatiellia bacterium]